MSVLTDSPMIHKYKEIMTRCIKMYYPDMDRREIDRVLDYSIQKRYKKADALCIFFLFDYFKLCGIILKDKE